MPLFYIITGVIGSVAAIIYIIDEIKKKPLKKFFRIILIILICCSVLFLGYKIIFKNPKVTIEQPTPKTWSISGIVFIDGVKKPGVSVHIKEIGKSVITDDTGKFTVSFDSVERKPIYTFHFEESTRNIKETRRSPNDTGEIKFYLQGKIPPPGPKTLFKDKTLYIVVTNENKVGIDDVEIDVSGVGGLEPTHTVQYGKAFFFLKRGDACEARITFRKNNFQTIDTSLNICNNSNIYVTLKLLK